MNVENSSVARAHRVTEPLRQVIDGAPADCPPGVDRFLWSADVLDEMARAAMLIGTAAEHASGDEDAELREAVISLSTAITKHRNKLLRHGHGTAPIRAARSER